MLIRHRIGYLGTAAALAFGTPTCPRPATAQTPQTVQFNRDIRPILSDNCFACHGPDRRKREAELRLDTREGLFGAGTERPIVTPGDLGQSELYQRITSADDDYRMPPGESGKSLTDAQREAIRTWIEQGAPWQGHWAYEPLLRPEPPTLTDVAGAPAEIDRFVQARLADVRLRSAEPADRHTLARRLALDLTGLPPAYEEVAAFEADGHPQAYEKLVDRLLASPHFGERMAIFWLDLVRYADSVGYHGDQPITVFPFRDYVIGAFNADLPFDRFTIEQLAGDLLPQPTREQVVAAGYNRLNMMSAEGGGQDKEYFAKYASDRVRTTSGAWMGATMGCCECHDHKFDPYTTRDFYRFKAFFADVAELGIYGGSNDTGKWGEMLSLPTPEQESRLKELARDLAAAEEALAAQTPERTNAQTEWESTVDRAALPQDVAAALAVEAAQRTAEQVKLVLGHFRSITPLLEGQRARVDELKRMRSELEKSIVSMPVTRSVEPRMVRMLPRGNWMDDSGEIVLPGVPEFLPQPAVAGERATRLDLAGWFVSRENPLTARVLANRLWKIFFGAGLSRRLDDVGVQGDWPSHPELLDWLAFELVDSGWDVKRLVKLIVISQTYRQSSWGDAESRERDPFNRWLSRQSRFRVDAEIVRDISLATSGLLVRRVGGASVKPYQPPRYWAYLNFPTREWENGQGDDLYRRGLYTHWQRQYLHPALLAFDAPSREECAADRPRSNTPLQSLVLLNDPSFVEAARAFAEKILLEGGATREERLDWAVRHALARAIRPAEQEVLRGLLEKHLAEYRADPGAAAEVAKNGAREPPPDLDRVELAAWTSVARAILNTSAVITRS